MHAWDEAFNERNLDHLLTRSAPDVELPARNGAQRGHDAVRALLHLQSYGVAQHLHARHYCARAATVAGEALIELRWVDSGDLADTTHAVGVFEVRDGRVLRLRSHSDLASPFRAAGWSRSAEPSHP